MNKRETEFGTGEIWQAIDELRLEMNQRLTKIERETKNDAQAQELRDWQFDFDVRLLHLTALVNKYLSVVCKMQADAMLIQAKDFLDEKHFHELLLKVS